MKIKDLEAAQQGKSAVETKQSNEKIFNRRGKGRDDWEDGGTKGSTPGLRYQNSRKMHRSIGGLKKFLNER